MSESDSSDFGKDHTTLSRITEEKSAREYRQTHDGKNKKKTKPLTEEERKADKLKRWKKRNGVRHNQMSRSRYERTRKTNPLFDLLDVQIEFMAEDEDFDSASSSGDEDTLRSPRKDKGKRKRGFRVQKRLDDISDEDVRHHARDVKPRIVMSPPAASSSPVAGPSTAAAMIISDEDKTADEADGAVSVTPMDVDVKPVIEQTAATIIDDEDNSDAECNFEARAAPIKPKLEDVKPVIGASLVAADNSDSDIDTGAYSFEARPKLNIEQEDVKPVLIDVKPIVTTSQQTYPRKQTRYKPHFDILNAEQDAVGPHEIGKNEHGQVVFLPPCIGRFLRPYQREGVEFFVKHYYRDEGGLLGDDMGLGKTIQVIAFLSVIMRKQGLQTDRHTRSDHIAKHGPPAKPTDLGATALIIVPASVTDNWARELDVWGYFQAEILRGVDDPKTTFKRFKKGQLDLMICGHDFARTHIEELYDLDLSCVIVDECHRIKNPKAATTIAFGSFLTKRRFGLTGTAIQNDYEELHTILNFSFPRRLGTLDEWKTWVSEPLKKAQSKKCSTQQLAVGRERAIALVESLLPRFFLRRTKDLIADQLPKKTDRLVYCPMTESQIAAYRNILDADKCQDIIHHAEPCPCGATDPSGMPYERGKCCKNDWPFEVFRYMTVLQKVSNHLCLIMPDRNELGKAPEKYHQDVEWAKMAFPTDHRDRVYSFGSFRDRSLCGKWSVLNDLLLLWKREGAKVLIFSRSVRLLTAVKQWLEEEYPNYLYLDGGVAQEKRLPLCDRFNNESDMFIFLISTLAGGVGLNLTAANKVVILDPNWNPSHDLQAMDRAYRWGQTRDVDVYRMIAAGSLEELIYMRQIYKQQQANIAYTATFERRFFAGVQGVKDEHGELFGVENIFRLGVGKQMTKYAIADCNLNELTFALKNLEDDDSAAAATETQEYDKGVLDLFDAEKAQARATSQSTDEISRILSANGVTYSHVNTAQLGGSKTEDAISTKAMKTMNNQREKRNALVVPASRASKASKATKARPKKSTAGKPSVTRGGVWPPPRSEASGGGSGAADQKLADSLGADWSVDRVGSLAKANGFKNAHDFGVRFASIDAAQQKAFLQHAKKKLVDYEAHRVVSSDEERSDQ